MIRRLIILLLIVGCEEYEDNDNCTLLYINEIDGRYYRCLEKIYTEKECLDKHTSNNGDYRYHSYTDQPCFEFCHDICGEGYPDECNNVYKCEIMDFN